MELAASLLKQPAESTKIPWNRNLTQFMECTSADFITEITEEMVLKLRVSTAHSVKTQLRYNRTLLKIAKARKWIDVNPTDGATKLFKVKAKVKQMLRLDEADDHWQELPKDQHMLQNICRWSSAHVSQVAVLSSTDIDLKKGVINITPEPLKHKTEMLKNLTQALNSQ